MDHRAIALFSSAAICATASPAKAFPFELNPNSFAEYMNTKEWKDGSTIKFLNLHDCQEDSDEDREGKVFRYYKCRSGYARITNPQGTQVCEISPPEGLIWMGIRGIGVYYSESGGYSYSRNKESCRWVSETEERDRFTTEGLPDRDPSYVADFTPTSDEERKPTLPEPEAIPPETQEGSELSTGFIAALAASFLAVGWGLGVWMGMLAAKLNQKKKSNSNQEDQANAKSNKT